jgi:hypothetical protein
MATRAELLTAFQSDLAAEGSYLLPAVEQPGRPVLPDGASRIEETRNSLDGTHTLEWHICFYWDQPALNATNAHFWVQDRGEAGEAAAWHKGQDPKPPAADPTFQQEMTAWLNSQIDEAFGSMTLRHIESTTANNDLERGTANVIMETGAGDFVRKSAAVWRAGANWQFQVVTEG